MKRFFLLNVFFVLLFCSKSNAQTVNSYSQFDGGTMYGSLNIFSNGGYEVNDVYPGNPTGFTLLYCTLYVWGEDANGSYVLINDTGPSYASGSFIDTGYQLHYSWECGYSDGSTTYICGMSIDYW